jgi:tetratricopeptide (TPR) repeat protein
LFVFWSRVDPELERFNATPLIGSDWAVLRDYLVVHQGNFAEGTAWPPRRNPDAERDLRPELEPWPEQARSEHIVLVHAPGALGEEERTAILERREAAWREAEARLAPAPDGYRYRLTVYADGEEKKQRTGVPDPAHGIPRARELHMTHELARAAGPHEEYHLLARELHGPAYITALYEGLAFWLEDRIHGASLCVNAGFILERGRVPALGELLDEEGFRALPREIGFPAAGLLVAWIVERGGMDALWKIHGLTEVEPERLAAQLSLPPGEMQASWEGSLRACRDGVVDEIAFRRALGEAQEAHRIGDHDALVAALERALRARPGDPQLLLDLASARLLAGSYEAARGDLERLLGAALDGELQHVETFAHLQLGRAHDLLGEREAALAQYRRVLGYPDVAGTHELARAGLERPITPDDLW